MIEKTVYDYLSQALAISVCLEEPEQNDPPRRTFVLIQKTGSSTENHITTATLAIQSYADSLYHAAELNETVKQAMLDMITLDTINMVTLVSDYEFTKVSTKQPRYQAVFEIVYYTED